ncbi:MAG: hypothetical protein GY790_17180 [Bacteroidetes bacterium]|nr:hypothetical protein [Bacteroidota bacterium]
MRKASLVGLILLVTITASSQEREYKTMIDFDQVKISGQGGPFMQFTAADGDFAHMMGGGVAVLVGDFFLGGYGLGLTNQVSVDRPAFSEYQPGDRLTISHGGFWLGYALFGDRAIHMTISSMIGWGELGVRGELYPENLWPDGIFVMSPTVEVEMNLTQFFRLGVGATYNLYTFVDLPGYTSSDFSAPGGFLSFKFGWF